MSLIGSIKKAVKKVFGDDDKKRKKIADLAPSMAPGYSRTSASMGPSPRRGKRTRGRDSTILTAGSGVNSRSLLG